MSVDRLDRIEGKLDQAVAFLTTVDKVVAVYGPRIDTLEAADHDKEQRLRALEQAPVVRPTHVWTAFAVLAPIIVAILIAVLF